MKKLFWIQIIILLASSLYAADPVVTSTAITTVDQDNPYSYTLTGSDADNDILTWSISSLPSWLSLNINNVSTFSGTGYAHSRDGDSSTATFATPSDIVIDSSGNFYITEPESNKIRKIDTNGNVTTFAGNIIAGFSDGNGASAAFDSPYYMAIDSDDNIYVSDKDNHAIRKIDTDGNVTTIAGNGSAGFTNDNGTDAEFNEPSGIAVDSSGNIYVVDTGNYCIRKIDTDGNVTTYAGTGEQGRDNGNRTLATFIYPYDIAIDLDGDIYIVEDGSYLIRKIDTSTGEVTTFAGSGYYGNTNGTANEAEFAGGPRYIEVDTKGNLYVAGEHTHRVRKIDVDGNVTTLVGKVEEGFFNGNGAVSLFHSPTGIAIDDSGNIYVADSLNHRIRKIIPYLLLGTPTNDDVGVHDVSLILSDGVNSVEHNFQITVINVNDDPTIIIDNTVLTDEDNDNSLTFSYTDVDGDTVTASVAVAATHGSIIISGTTITYTPVANYNGSDTFTITLTDGRGYTVNKVISVTVNSINDIPTIIIDSTLTTDEDNNQSLTFSFTDIDGDTVTASETVAPTHGTIVIIGTNITYTPVDNYNGSDIFTITLTDGKGYTVDKTVTITINSVNDIPTITIDSTLTTDEDNNQSLAFSFTDVDGDTVTASATVAPIHGTISITGLNITYSPNENYNGSDEFTITLTDSQGYTIDKVIVVTINSVNDLPTITIDETMSIIKNDKGRVSFVFSDVESGSGIVTVQVQPVNGVVIINGTEVTYTPNIDYVGSDEFTLSFEDGDGAVVTKLISVNITSDNANGLDIVNNGVVIETENSDNSHSFQVNYTDSSAQVGISATGQITYSSGGVTGDIDAGDQIFFNADNITTVSTLNDQKQTIVIASSGIIDISVASSGSSLYSFHSSIFGQKITQTADGSITISASNSDSSVSISRTETEFVSVFTTSSGTREVKFPLIDGELLSVELVIVDGQWELKINTIIPDTGITF